MDLALQRGHVFKYMVAPLPIHKVRRRRSVAREAQGRTVFPDIDESARVAKLQGPYQQGVDHAKNRHIGSNTQGERQDRARRKSWRAMERAQTVSEIREEGSHPLYESRFGANAQRWKRRTSDTVEAPAV